MENKKKSSQLTLFKKIIIYEKEEIKVIDQCSIIRVESDRSYSLIYFTDGTHKIISRPLVAVDNELSSEMFFRIHRSHLVNMGAIKSISKGCKRVRLIDGVLLPIAEKRIDLLIQALKEFGS